MGQPAWKRREKKRSGTMDAAVAKQQQQAARSQPKKQRRRPMGWEKRGEEKHGLAETREQDAQILADINDCEAQLAAEHDAEEMDMLPSDGEYEMEEYEERQRAAQAQAQTREAEDLERQTYLPVNEIDDTILVPPTRDARPPVQPFDCVVVISRSSGGWSRDEQAAQTSKSKLVAKQFYQVIAGMSADKAEFWADTSQRTTHLLMHRTSKGFRNTTAGFNGIISPMSCHDYKVLVTKRPDKFYPGLFYPGRKIMLLIRGVDGFLMDINLFREVNEHAARCGATVHVCFYLAKIAKFSLIWPLSAIVSTNNADRTEQIQYLQRRLASLARARYVEDGPNWNALQRSEWGRKYAPHRSKGRNVTDNIAAANGTMDGS